MVDKYGVELVDEHCQGCDYLENYRGLYWELVEYCSYYAYTGLHMENLTAPTYPEEP